MKRFQHLHLETDHNHVLWLTLDSKPHQQNRLSIPVLEELAHALTFIQQQSFSGLVLRSAQAPYFSAGFDFTYLSNQPDYASAQHYSQCGQNVCQQLANLPFPTIALITGHCIGAGLELALACRYRIALDDAAIHFCFDHIHHGLHPAFGGTQRACQHMGIANALKCLLSGITFSVQEAKQYQLLDAVVTPEQLETALHTALKASAKKNSCQTVGQSLKPLRYLWTQHYQQKYQRPTPTAVVDHGAGRRLVQLWTKYGNSAAFMAAEAESFATLSLHPTTQHLVRIAARVQTLQQFATPNRDWSQQEVHIIGSNVYAEQLLNLCQQQHIPVHLHRPHSRVLEQLQHATLIIEAIQDNLAAKQQWCVDLEQAKPAHAVLATLSTSLHLDAIAKRLQMPEQLLGLHCWPWSLPHTLVEVIQTPQTPVALVQFMGDFIRRLHKIPLFTQRTAGFLLGRIALAYILEGVRLHQQGIPANVIDEAARQFGMQWGPLEFADRIGIATCQQLTDAIEKANPNSTSKILTFHYLLQENRTGKAAGHGFYKYRHGKIFMLTRETWQGNHDALRTRLIQSVVQATQRCHTDGIVSDPQLLDTMVVLSLGFPALYGGPLQYAQDIR